MLRICSPSENQMNKVQLKSNSTGVTGVSFDRDLGKYRAYIYISNKKRDLGSYSNIAEAREARLLAEQNLFGDFSYNKTVEGNKVG